jgi:enoyl-CoA hydratase
MSEETRTLYACDRLVLTARGDVGELLLCAEPCNEIGLEMLDALCAATDAIEASSLRALVIRSSVRRGFSAGADLRSLYAGLVVASDEERDARVGAFIDRIHGVFDQIDTLPLVTVAVVHGVCFGGGFELALLADVRIAERSARFCFPELRLGLVPGFGGIPRLEREVGQGVVRDVLLTGRSLNAKTAQGLGLVSQVVAPGEGERAAGSLARQILRFEGEVVRHAKAFTKKLPRARLDEEKALFLQMIRSPHVREGLRAFVENTGPLPYLPG